MTLLLAWRQFLREFRAGELRLLFAALCIAVAAVTAVSFFTDRVRQGLAQEARQMTGGDLAVLSDHPLPEPYREAARQRGLQTADTWVFPSMVIFGDAAQLADIKAVTNHYPLRGRLAVADALGDTGVAIEQGPPAGTVWLDERLATLLGARPGQVLALGGQSFRIGAILTREPDRSINFFTLAPRLMMHADDLPSTGLIQFGARVRYTFLIAGEADAVNAYRRWLEPQLGRGERIEDAGNARPEIRQALDRTERFLGLATLLTVILSAVATAQAARRYTRRHLDACAIMRCLGMPHRRLLFMHAAVLGGLSLVAGTAGCVLGYLAHHLLAMGLTQWLALVLPSPGMLPIVAGLVVSAVLLFGFAFPPLLQMVRVPTIRVLRREMGPPEPSLLLAYLAGLAMLGGLIIVVAGNLRLGLLTAGGFMAALAIFWGIARLLLGGLSRVRTAMGFGWRHGVANLYRHRQSVAIQVVALAIGLMAVVLLTVVRGELLDAWQQSIPSNAPNRFIINIQPEQRIELQEALAASGLHAELEPMVRARLVSIGGRAVGPADYPADERAQRLIEREFNLSWRADLPAGNRVVGGRWFDAGDTGQGVASVEEGLAKTLGIRVGDSLAFQVGGETRTLRVTSLRKLSWDSMRVNFFVLAPPGILDALPASYITSFHLQPTEAPKAAELIRRFPNLTLIDVSALLAQLQAVIGQVAAAVQFVFLFSIAAGVVVLHSALLSAFDERRYELAVMRSLGAGRDQLSRALRVELALVGAMAGLLAALGALALGQMLGRQIFQLDMPVQLWVLPLSMTGGAILSLGVGWLAIRRLVSVPPLQVLRQGV